MSLGDKVRQIRKQRGLSQEELGEKVGLQRSQISKIESNDRRTTYERQIKLAEALNCNVADFYDEKFQLDEEGKRWAIFNEKMKDRGYTPEELEEWLKLTEKIMKKNEDE